MLIAQIFINYYCYLYTFSGRLKIRGYRNRTTTKFRYVVNLNYMMFTEELAKQIFISYHQKLRSQNQQ